jgi:hypothetical protein
MNAIIKTPPPQNTVLEPKSDMSLLDVDSARAVAQIQGAMAIAKRFPRDENQALNRITAAAKRQRVAEQAEYEYSKGGTSVSGPSIRAAEVVSQAWGNMISGISEVKRDMDKKESVMLAYAADMETNNWKFLEWTVGHTIDTRAGAKALSSGRDIYERVMNDGSRRLRNCIIAVIPGDVMDHFTEECNRTLSSGSIPLKIRLGEMIKAMEPLGVTQAMIEDKMGCSYGSLTERQLTQIRRVYQSLKDGFGVVSDYFKESTTKTRTEALKEALKVEEPKKEDKGSFDEFFVKAPGLATETMPEEITKGGPKK